MSRFSAETQKSDGPKRKLEWNKIIAKYADLCGHYYALASNDDNAKLLFEKYVRVLEAYLIPYWPSDWEKKKAEMVKSMAVANARLRSEQPKVYETEKQFRIFKSLMQMIKDSGLIDN